MKAFLLAAGKGTRLRPLTFHTPKCLVPICGKPLVEYWFALFRQYDIQEILMNTSHLAEKVRSYVRKSSPGVKVKLTYEKNLLGSGGAVKENWDFVRDDSQFLICYADNLTNINLSKMLQFHSMNKRDFTIAVTRVSNPEECGVVQLDDDSTVVGFEEKPKRPLTDLAFAGIMLSNQSLIHYLPDKTVFDLAYDVLPRLIGNVSGYIMTEYLLDIGNYNKLHQADKDIQSGAFSSGK
jgi:mannose-1-phosphate guanylyltransferase